MGNIQTLTGLRGFAALIVFISHSANQQLFPTIFGNGFGQLGVMLFFILSGFLMGYLYLDKPFNQQTVYNYAVARIARILPLYFGLVILSFVISNAIYSDFHYSFTDMETLIKTFILYSAPYEFWTIPIEFQFYVIFVFLWFFKTKDLAIPYITLTLVVGLIVSIWYYQTYDTFLYFVNSYLVPFCVGILLSRKTFLQHAKNNNVIALTVLAVFLTVNLPAVRLEYGWVLSDSFFIRTWVDPINWLIVFGLFYFAVIESPAYRFLNHTFFTKLGEISFGFYLFHYPIIKLVKLLPLPTYVNLCIAFTLIWLLAHYSYLYFEQTSAAKIKGLAKSLR